MIKQQNAGTKTSRRRAGLGRRRALMLSAGTLALVCAQPALAQVVPTGGVVTTGDATIGSTGAGNVTVTQNSDRVLIDWDSFDIGSGGSVHFDMDATDIAVNRDNAGDPSEIYGTLTGDGMIMILNPNGVLFGAGANVNVGSLVATSASLTDVSSNLLSFTGASGAVTVAAGAAITVADAGLAAFVAPSVANNGIITATGGHVFLGGAEGFTLDLANDGLLELTVPTASPLVQNHGDIFAAGGRIQMSAAAASALVGAVINVQGVLQVGSASSDGGVIVLEAAGNAIEVSDDLAVQGNIDFVARRVFGAGDVDVDDGALSLNIDPDGADTTGETLIADALGVIGSVDGGTTLNLGAGDYAAGAIINATNVTVDGGGVARIIANQNGQNGLTVAGNGDGAVIQGLHFIGQADTSYNGFAWGSTITRGVVLLNGAENVTVTDNVITGVRNGILIDGRNDGSIITDNIIDNTKSAISVQYTDGSNLTLTGNAEGQFGNEWGINVHLNGVWNGSTISPSAGSLGANPSAAAQQHLLDLSNANSGMSVYNQAYSASNRTHVYVDANGSPTGQGAAPSPISTVHGGVAAVVNGGQVFVADGLYTFTSTLNIDKSLSLIGESRDGVFFDGTAINGYGMEVNADDVTLANFTFQGNNASTNSGHYGIKVQPDTGDASDRVHDFTIQNVAIQGWGGSELDLNGVVGALIDGVIADGQGTKGVGIGLTDSADVTIVNSETLNNLWGSVALYQTNRFYDQQLDNITINADLNVFAEDIGVFAQSYSSIGLEIGQLNLTGFDFVVRNTGHRSNGDEFTFFRTDLDDAAAFALGLGAAETSSIEGWSGTDYTNAFTVVNGLTIGAAIRDVRDGGFINVGAGTYGAFGTAFGGPENLTITGADGAIIDGAGVTGRIIDLRADGTTLSGFTIQGDGGGVGVSVSGRGVTVADNTISDVLTGVQTTTQYAAGNAVITGNTITADYGVSLQNTGNVVTGNTVNAAIEGVGLLQGANSFSGNSFTIAAGGDALNYYGSATYAALVAADNTVSIEGGGLQGAVDLAGAGGLVDAGAATYNETITIRHGLTLAGAGMDQTHLTGGINLSNTAFSNLTLRGFTLSGDGGGNALVRNGRVTNLTIDGVRFDGGNVAGRHGFAGGQFGGDISITNSEFIDIRGWSAFDTSTGGTATAITSVVFSNNLLDGTVGHVTFRQATPTADVLISGNIVRNVGDTTDLSSGIFKVFGAATVDFVDNEITGIGASPTRFTGGVNDGAALIVRGVGTLNITDNIFTDNQQAFLVGAGNALPTVTNITGNIFDNNAYDIFLPASTGGTINFGAGNNFITGDDTVMHLTWVGATGLDMTGVMFNGELASAMSLDDLFALEDRIYHGVDQAGAGLVRVVDGQLFVTQSSGSIQRGVNLAASGDTIHVGEGEFSDRTITLDRSVTLLGAQSGNAAATGDGEAGTGDRGGETVLTGSGPYVFRVTAEDVTIDGFTFTGAGGRLIETSGTAHGLSIVNNIFNTPSGHASNGLIYLIGSANDVLIANNLFSGDGGAGYLWLSGAAGDGLAGLTVRDNDFSGDSDRGIFQGGQQFSGFELSGNYFGSGILTGVNMGHLINPLIQGNHFDGVGYAAMQIGVIGGGTIRDNLVDGTGVTGYNFGAYSAAYGIQIWGGAYGTPPSEGLVIEGNTVLNYAGGGADDRFVGIYIGADAGPNIQVTGNTLSGNSIGLWSASAATGLTLTDNVFTVGVGGLAIRNSGSATIELMGGANTINGVDTDSASLEELFGIEDLIDHGLDQTGYGLVRVVDGQLFVTQNSGSIQRAVDLSGAGEIVNVGAGTFGGFATAFGGPADLTIQSVNGAIIDGAGVTGRIIDLRADGTTLSGFTIQGDGGGVGVSVSGQGVTVADNTISDVLTGVQTTTQYTAGNAVITGNTITADYGVSLQNTGNVVTGNTVNAAVEGVGLLQGANSFSGNSFTIAAGGDALNYYGSATYAALVAADNTVSIEGGGLQGALDLAGAAGSVDAGAATYDETVTIRHGLTLTGAGQGDTVINGGVVIAGHAPAGSSIDGLTIEGLTINAGAGQVGLIALSNSVDGVYNTTNLTVTDVTINGDGQHAVGLFDVNGATFDNVTINAAAGFNGIEALGLNGFFMAGGAIHGAVTGVNVWELAGYEANGGLVFLGVDFADNRTHLSLEGAGAVLEAILSSNSFDRTIHATDGDTIYGDLAWAVGDAAAGSELNLSADTFALTSALVIDRALSLVGAGQGQTIIDASGAATYGIRVHADDVSLSGFTLSGGSGYGIKVEAAGSPSPDQRRTGFTIADVTIENTGRTGLDLNAVIGATIDGVTVTGVANGNGISITDSADVTVRNSTTSGNAWAGIGLFQRNNVSGGGSDQQLTDIVIDDSNTFGEDTAVYVQVYADALNEVGTLTVGGFDFVVQNDDLDGGVSSYVFFDRSLQDAINRGVNLVNASESVVGGWTGTGSDGNLYVGFGDLLGGGQAALSIQTAFDASGDGDTINIAAGDYGQSATLDEARTVLFDEAGVGVADFILTAGAAGSGFSGQLTASGDIDLQGDIILNGDLGLTGAGVSLAGVDGSSVNGQSLVIEADAISIASAGAAIALDSLLLFGDATLTGAAYNAAGFLTTGATTLANDVSITVDGSLVMGAIDGAHDLSIEAGSATLGAVGAVDALTSLDVAASTIATTGVTTTGGQSYAGALTLNGGYAAGGAFSVNGATTLGGDVEIMTQGGDVMLGLIDGAHGLTIAAGSGDVTLGPVGSAVAVDDLVVSGGVVTTAGAASTGAQSWSGDAVRLSGAFTTAGGDFTVSGPATLNGATTIVTAGGDAVLGSVDGATPGGQSFRLDVGAGSVELGALGALARLGATVVRANTTVLTGDTYAANSLSFMGAGADATVRLTELLTTFNTVQSAGQAGAISIAPHLIGTTDGEQGVVFLAGTGGSAGDGDITLGDAGSDDLRLGLMTVSGGDFTAQTVMLAGDFTSTLSGDQVFSDDTLNTLGDVNASVAGDETGPIVAGGSVTIETGGSANGSITAGGPVTVTAGGDTDRTITSGGAVVLTSTGGSVGGSVQADGPVTVSSAGTITGAYASGGDIVLNAGQSIDVQVDGDVVQVDAPGGVVTGVFSEITTDEAGTFVINGETVVGTGQADARQILIDGFIAPVGGVVGPTGVIQLPVGLALALVSPAGDGAGQRPAVLVNNVGRLGELLRLGYTAIVIQIDDSGLLIEEELILADTEQQQAAGVH